MINLFGYEGKFVISVRNTLTGEVTETVIHNRIMDDILDELAETLLGNSTDLQIMYLALGTSNTPVTNTDTQLGTEIFRTIPSQASARTAVGQIETEFTILDNEAIAIIEEVAIFVGSNATSTANTGKLLSRILWHKDKTSGEEITFKRIERLVRA